MGTPLECLQKLKLVVGNTITNAAYLLFANESTGYNVHLGRFKTPSFIIDDKMLNGTLFDVVEDAMRYIISHLKVAFEIKGMTTQRTEIFEYPIPALRELLLNAIIHRDYTSSIDVQIKIFDQSIRFFNPGNLFGNLDIEDLKTDNYQAFTRNKLIAEAFYLTGDIEKYGSGFIRIRKELLEYPSMQCIYSELGNGFQIELKYLEQKIQTDLKTDLKIDDIDSKIILIISEDNFISIPTIAKKIGKKATATKNRIQKLKTIGVLQRIGAAKGGYWKINR